MGKEKKKKEKLSLWQTLKNDVYAIRLAGSFSKPAIFGAFFCMLIGYAEWVFFDGFCGEDADEAKKTGRFSNPPEIENQA